MYSYARIDTRQTYRSIHALVQTGRLIETYMYVYAHIQTE